MSNSNIPCAFSTLEKLVIGWKVRYLLEAVSLLVEVHLALVVTVVVILVVILVVIQIVILVSIMLVLYSRHSILFRMD